MGFLIFLMFVSLAASVFLSLIRKGKAGTRSRIFRTIVVVLSIACFSYWFFERSLSKFVQDSLAVQLVNKLPQPLDFYILKKTSAKSSQSLTIKHLGKIRPDHYMVEYLQMQNSDEFWVAGYLGKKNLVYFSQHAVPNKNMDQIIEVQNYINQSQKLSNMAMKQVSAYQSENIFTSIWVTLCLLLLFMNVVLLFQRK